MARRATTWPSRQSSQTTPNWSPTCATSPPFSRSSTTPTSSKCSSMRRTSPSVSKENRNSLVIEFANKGSLLDSIKEFEVTSLVHIFHQLSSAVRYLHSKDICHRDLKLENVLIFQEKGEVLAKLADFGFASSCKKGKQILKFSQFKGTRRGYMAPEIFAVRKHPGLQYEGKPTDIFALGVILFALVFKTLPFEEGNEENRRYKLLIDQKYEQFWNDHNVQKKELELGDLEEFKALFVRMVKFQPQERPELVGGSQSVGGNKSRLPDGKFCALTCRYLIFTFLLWHSFPDITARQEQLKSKAVKKRQREEQKDYQGDQYCLGRGRLVF